MPGILFVVGTPIGNLSDFSPRAIETLNNCDFIAAEDTRVTLKLLNHFDIKKPMISYFEHNRRERGEIILNRILDGENCALVTDAGMPAISDPGQDLVDIALDSGVKVESVPGPTAFATALAISGFPSGRFTFEGFLSVNKPSRREHLESIVNEKRTMIFYEAPHKLVQTLKDLNTSLGDRKIAIVKEITKIHESVDRTTLQAAAEKYAAMPSIKGEFVLIVYGAPETEKESYSLSDAVALAKNLMSGGAALNDAAKQSAKVTDIKKGDIYKALTEE